MQPDQLEEHDFHPKEKNPVFSKIAFCFAILSPTLIILAVANTVARMKAIHEDRTVSLVLGRLGLLSVLLGLFFTVASLYRKEKLKYLKLIAAILNIGIFLILLFIVAFAFVMDWKRLHQ